MNEQGGARLVTVTVCLSVMKVDGKNSKLLEYLNNFANELHCFLCNKLFKSPRTATQCGHVYCNECIQKYLKSGNNKCPQCPVPINGKSLTRNDSYATMVQCVAKIQNLLLNSSTLTKNDEDVKVTEEKNKRDADVFMSVLGDMMTTNTPAPQAEQVHDDENMTQLEVKGGVVIKNQEQNQNIQNNENKIDPISNSTKLLSKPKPKPKEKSESKLKPAESNKKVKVTTIQQPTPPARATEPPQKIGLLLTGLSDDQKFLIQTNLSKMSKLSVSKEHTNNPLDTPLPFTIEREYSPDTATHIICACGPKSKCPRTLKYLLGIAGKSWIVSFDWFLESLTAGKILPEEQYVVKGDEAVQIDTEACERSRSDAGKLFHGVEFYLAGPFNAPGPSKSDLAVLIGLAGGTVVKKPESDTFLVSNNLNGPKPGEKSYTWLFDCVSFYKIQP